MLKLSIALGLLVVVVLPSCSLKHSVSIEASSTQAMTSPFNAKTQALYTHLRDFAQQKQFIFGQEKAVLSGVGENGDKPWNDSNLGNQTDAEAYIGQKVGLMGMDIWDLAMKNPSWNQPQYAKAIRDFYNDGKGGVITLDWHMRGCSVSPVIDASGKSGIPGEGFKVNDWDEDPNADCLCKIVNSEPWTAGKTWKDWFIQEKLDKFYQKLVDESLTEIPMIYRPFHEQTGNWFWWGAKGWNCQRQLGKANVVSGAEAYKQLFRMTVDHLRQTRGLKNLLIAYAPDKLCKHEGHTCNFQDSIKDNPNDTDLRNDYLNSYPGDAYVDILGIDLYYAQKFGNPWEEADYQTKLYSKYLKVISKIAEEKTKVAALTETGNYNLQNEASTGSEWFTKHLLAMLSDPDIKMAYALTWENRQLASTEYYIPHKKHADYADFVKFSASPSSLFYNDLLGLYSSSTMENPAPASGASGAAPASPQTKTYASCASAASDPDGDGWGFENGQSCLVQFSSYPTCRDGTLDKDQDGFAIEDNQLCHVKAQPFAACISQASDPDGDGWGFEDNHSCLVPVIWVPHCVVNLGDSDGDGWGFENNHSCRIRTTFYPSCASRASDPDGDGWGFENGVSCRVR